MGTNVTFAFVDHVLSDDELTSIGLHPTGLRGTLDSVYPGNRDRAVVVRTPWDTMIGDPSTELGMRAGTSTWRGSGLWTVATLIDMTGHTSLKVVRDGQVVRHLEQSEDGLVDAGQPIFDESFLLERADDEEIAEWQELGEDYLVRGEYCIDGDAMLEDLGEVLGLITPRDSLWQIEGTVYTIAV